MWCCTFQRQFFECFVVLVVANKSHVKISSNFKLQNGYIYHRHYCDELRFNILRVLECHLRTTTMPMTTKNT